ncbi:glucosamine--fructose-6-phosphate aminotransferase (isomerizing) [Breznakia sp. PF5-3]|uniref:SIS domain-containing protein n=1 Tax=unclassified Breznakia TaxID=2623764 RepID=UPI0024061649|nr:MULTISPECIES: SIS domain-containing protein [unclassified Breznakia]MDF9824766.1 glucosamine--fructose-6-phosphate aminotransferase (isomerizing) [Breznakia sp. PM6-1]MDF9835667.1 glucosamine--fructose-6-phosphate aminotransferase (isomerizing) [Breznakia sp. PF5-3]MDF9837716.1 glucosamine--fructose-6-phosphate aminotransferase (isomerizing) [Breznakia sp. PFB2-8]MDF9859677.1 glucosamine--fructose-6-phosphate aminotransferase (isomerizing) [Breznakia sp. PH5-24]
MIRLETSKLWKEIHEQDVCIKNCLQINLPHIKKIADEVHKRGIKTVVFAARGSSDHAAKVGKYLIEIYSDMIASTATPSVVTCYNGKTNYQNALVVGISQSGAAKDCYMVMEKCVKDGGICVSITNERDSLMSTIGDYRLNNECGVEESITAAKSYITQLTLVTALAAYLSKDQGLIDSLDTLANVVKDAYTLENQVKAIIPIFRNSERLLLFGRGLLYGLCEEAELKIQETSYLDARCYASSDYQHGPIATATSFIPTIFFIADKKTNDSIVQLHDRLKKEKNILSLIVTNDEEISKLGDYKIMIPNIYDGIQAVFASAVVAQMFSCLLALARGYNPDTPIGVSKHTVTI